MAQEIDTVHLQLALTSLSKHISTSFPKILPLKLYTIGGALMITIIGNRISTEDVDVSIVKLIEKYGSLYPNIQSQFNKIISNVSQDLRRDGVDIGEAWMNWSVDLVLPDGII